MSESQLRTDKLFPNETAFLSRRTSANTFLFFSKSLSRTLSLSFLTILYSFASIVAQFQPFSLSPSASLSFEFFYFIHSLFSIEVLNSKETSSVVVVFYFFFFGCVSCAHDITTKRHKTNAKMKRERKS